MDEYEVFARSSSGVECRVVARPVPKTTAWSHGPIRLWNTLTRRTAWEVFVERADRVGRSRREVVGDGAAAVARADALAGQLQGGGGLQVYTAPERAGHGSCTLIVTDIDEIVQLLKATDLAPNAQPARNDQVDTVMIADPDGNSIAFAAPKDASLAGGPQDT